MFRYNIIAPLLALTLALPAGAQDMQDDGPSLLERGLQGLMQDFIEDVGPDLNRLGQNMANTLDRMAPVMDDLSVLVDDLENYQMPERLENGDIIIRRRADAPPPPPLSLDPNTPPEPLAPDIPINPDAPEIEL